MKNTGIVKKIEKMILLELALFGVDKVWQYRDEHFLNGSFDYLFKKYIKKHKLKN